MSIAVTTTRIMMRMKLTSRHKATVPTGYAKKEEARYTARQKRREATEARFRSKHG
jgi:hypothetical protein